MLGGSAPSQTSGAPHRTESDSRAAGWPSTPDQSEICNRSCGIYTLFPGPGETPKTLYTSAAKNSSNFQDFVGTQKVPNEFFSKFFLTNETHQYDTSSHPDIQPEISRLKITSESFGETPKSFSLCEKNLEKQNISTQKGSKTKRSNDITTVKSEMEEGAKIENENMSVLNGHRVADIKSLKNINERKHDKPPTENECSNAGNILANEPDSTEFRNLNNTKTIQGAAEVAQVKNLDKKPIAFENNVALSVATSVDSSYISEIITKEKCSIKFCDSANESGSKKKTFGELSVEVEPVNDMYVRLAEKKASKTPDSNCKSSPFSSRKLYEPSKTSPTRTLSLSPQNGGCSRTTPVTFRHTSQQEPDTKSQNLQIEVPPLLIKKEPSDFQKNYSGSPFLSPAHFDNFFSPSGLNVLDGQLLSPMPYSSSFESSERQKESFLGPLNQTFINPSQTYLAPRLVAENPFLSPNLDIGRFGSYKNYPALPKIGGNYLITNDKFSEGVFLKNMGCLPPREDHQSDDSPGFINSTALETESKNKMPDKTICNGSNVTPCQVAEVTSASSLLSPNHSSVNPLVVKQETTTTTLSSGSSVMGSFNEHIKETSLLTSGQSTLVSSTVGAQSPGQRCQQRLNEIKISSNNVSSPPIIHKSVTSPLVDLHSNIRPALFAGSLLGDRSANLVTTWPTQQTHSPNLWQYSAPIDYPPFPPVGFQLVRDPITGHFLLIPASNIEALQRALLWPSYQSSPPQVIIPPLSVQPSTPHLIVDTNVPAVDFLTSGSIHRNAPQHRILIASNNSKRKDTTPTVIKVEASDCSNAVVVTTCDSNNIYSKTKPVNLIARAETTIHSQRTSTSTETGRKSQATSPCLNPVLENMTDFSSPEDSDSKTVTIKTVTLQDASNQTDLLFETETKGSISTGVCKDKFKPYTKTTEQNVKVATKQDVGTETVIFKELEDDKRAVLKEIHKKNEIQESLNINCDDVPDSLNIKKETISPLQVDLSGLELLSNSIEQFVCEAKCGNVNEKNKIIVKSSVSEEERKDLSSDACEGAVLLQNLRNGFREVNKSETYENEPSKNLGGLGLLCALAEQRFKEEIGKEVISSDEVNLDDEKRCEEKDETDENILERDLDFKIKKTTEKCDLENTCLSDPDLPVLKKEVEITDNENSSSEVGKKIIADEQLKQNEGDTINLMPGTEKVTMKRGPGRPRKLKSIKEENSVLNSFLYSKSNRNSKEMSPPVLEKEGDYVSNEKIDLAEDSLSSNLKEDIPPTLTPSTIVDPVIKTMAGTLALTPCEVNLIALKINKEKLKKNEKSEGTKPAEIEVKKRKLSNTDSPFSSSKKRKVGRPKKHDLLNHNSMTETIVAKKPKTKSYLLQFVQAVESENVLKTKNNEDKPLNAMSLLDDVTDEENKSKKIRPKLKAEPKVKEWIMQDNENLERRKTLRREDNSKQKIKIQKSVAIEGKKFNQDIKNNVTKDSTLTSCMLTAEHLKSEKFPIRTLTVMGGLFYAGQLSAIRPPDVYGITIDGERGNRPHIYSREEILKDSIFEVKPEKTSDLLPGTRCCAYWSEQYRCLYPGTISAPVSPDPELDDKFVNVEFDDGDSGRINIDDIRLLPKDYPIVEYDPNPLQSLSKRKRRISGTSTESHSKERKSTDFLSNPDKNDSADNRVCSKSLLLNEEFEPKKDELYEPGSFLSKESERKHLKKKRREKLKRLQSLSIEGKKKHKKHKCLDEHRHHRHHKKHRKHKHKHGKRHNGDLNEDDKKGDEAISRFSNKYKKNYKCKSVVNSCKLSEKSKTIKPKKCKERTESVESRSKMAAFLPARQLWGWSGKGFRRPGAKGRARKEFYKTIQRGKERITVGDCAVFLSTGRPDRPYIGRIESMWESWGTNMIVRVKWFYHPEETVGCPATLEYPGALFESPHVDENDVQTISHKCEVLPLKEYTTIIGNDPQKVETIYDNNDIYYLAGYYDPTNTTLKMEPGVK